MNVKLKKLSDQVIVITGASSGIGLVTARMAAKRGNRSKRKLSNRSKTKRAGAAAKRRLSVKRKRRAKRPPSIAGSRLDPDIVEVSRLKNLAVSHAIKRNATSQNEVLASCQLTGAARQFQNNILCDLLDGESHVHVDLVDF